MRQTFFHTSYLTVMYCHSLSNCCCTSHPSLCHRFGKNRPLLIGFIRSLLSLLGRMHNYCLLLVSNVFSLHGPRALILHTTWADSVVTRTLLFHTYYSCAGSVIGSYTHNHTTYVGCSHGNHHICFNPTYPLRSNG
jgi:hypothetical protein